MVFWPFGNRRHIDYFPHKNLKILVTGVSGFVGSHVARALRSHGHHVVGADWRIPEPGCISTTESCDEFLQIDLRSYANCLRATTGCAHVFHFAADMGGMGFIQSNHSACGLNNSLMDLHMIEACRVNEVRRVFYSSSACVYPTNLQNDERALGLKETDAWPADPQDAYGLEKLFAEDTYGHYASDFGMSIRIARFHNVYGPRGAWNGGREKSPAALCRKIAATSDGGTVDVWGDGRQTRSYVYVDDLVEGVLRLMACEDPCVDGTPVNIGTEDLVSIDALAGLIARVSGKKIEFRHVRGPEGVRGRNSDNTVMRSVLNGWEPMTSLGVGIEKTYDWISRQVMAATPEDRDSMRTSIVSRQTMVPLPSS